MEVPIVERFADVVEYTRTHGEDGKVIADPGPLYYIFGHRQEIARKLTVMEKDPVNRRQKYPLIALRMDIPEKRADGLIHVKLNVLILTKTAKEDWAKDRYNRSFKPVLYPLYERLKVALRDSGIFFWDGDQGEPTHVKIDRPYWGQSGAEANTANFMDDIIDAIELIDLDLSTNITQTC